MPALTVYLTSSTDTLVATAEQLAAAPPSVEASFNGALIAKSTGWIEVFSGGSQNTVAVAVSEPAPSGHGWIWDVTTLEGGSLLAGTWTPKVKLALSASSCTASVVLRVWKRSSAGVYTQIGTDMIAAARSLTTTGTIYSPTAVTTVATTAFAAGDKLYVDVLVHVTVAAGLTSSGVLVYRNGGANEAVATPGYSQTVALGGAVAVVMVVSATAAVAIHAGGAAVLALTPSATIRAAAPLAASAALTLTPAGTLSEMVAVAAASALTFSVSGTSGETVALDGSATAAVVPSGTLSEAVSLNGTSVLAMTAGGALLEAAVLAGTASLTLGASATAGVTAAVPLAGLVSLTVVAAGASGATAALCGGGALSVSGSSLLAMRYWLGAKMMAEVA